MTGWLDGQCIFGCPFQPVHPWARVCRAHWDEHQSLKTPAHGHECHGVRADVVERYRSTNLAMLADITLSDDDTLARLALTNMGRSGWSR